MEFLMRRITIGVIITSMAMIACTPSKVLTRDNDMNFDDRSFEKEEDFTYNDDLRVYNEDIDSNRQSRNSRRSDEGTKRDSYDGTEREDDKFGINRDNESSRRERFYQKGFASWYGREFQGSMTASGKRFNMNKLTAAHRTLPFGTLILVKNMDNGRSVRAIINDRGPYRDGRILDLSYAAARKLDMITKGEAKVGIIVLRKGLSDGYKGRGRNNDIEPVAGVSSRRGEEDGEYLEKDRFLLDDEVGDNRYLIQAGAFYSRRNAKKAKRQLEDIVENPVVLIHEDDMYKVRIEGVRSRGEAERYKKRLAEEDISSYILHNGCD